MEDDKQLPLLFLLETFAMEAINRGLASAVHHSLGWVSCVTVFKWEIFSQGAVETRSPLWAGLISRNSQSKAFYWEVLHSTKSKLVDAVILRHFAGRSFALEGEGVCPVITFCGMVT